ncbi:hypothetical protein D3C72_2132890 [compost metagenome]
MTRPPEGVEVVDALLAAMLLHSLISSWVCCEVWPFSGTTVWVHPWALNNDSATHRPMGDNLFMMIS